MVGFPCPNLQFHSKPIPLLQPFISYHLPPTHKTLFLNILQQKNIRSMQADLFKTDLEYLLILDFEATCDDNIKLAPCSQIIEFPVTIVHTPTARKLDSFHHYVRPTLNPKLTPFCVQLTGITQDKVDSGITIQETLEKLDAWIKARPYLKEGNWTFVTCGDWDLATCLKHQSRTKNLKLPPYLRSYLNIKKYFAKLLHLQKSGGMMQMLSTLALKHQGRHHSGIDDVSNIANICLELITRKAATFPREEITRLKYYLEKDGHNTEIQYLLVLDFEATCEENKKLAPCSEIIEFPCIVVHTTTAKRVAQFHHYVKPRYNPILTPFCTQLTGITQQQVDQGKPLQQILQDFDAWTRSLPFLRQDNWTFVTCGDWDLATCLKTEATVKSLPLKNYFKSYLNIKKYFSRVTKGSERVDGMMKMLAVLKLKHEGRHHSGIDDVANIANICIELIVALRAAFPRKEIVQIKY